MPKYQATEYVRLSYADDRMNESDSITNQKKLIADFLKGHPEIELVSERIDDGYSGILFDRPAFQEMMDDIRSGKINCVIVKDLSRLGREYIETGRYLRQIFPAYGVRFIAITDGIDTANDNPGDDLTVSMKSIINDAYCHDISVKTRSALLTKRKDGDYVGACPKSAKYVKMKAGEYQSVICPYGYRKSADGRMEPDEETAPNVSLIFEMAAQGYKIQTIIETLFEKGILTPGEHKASKGKNYHDVSRCCHIWSRATVLRLLEDERYIGTYIMRKRKVVDVGSSHVRKRDESERFKIPDHHPAIIEKELFDRAQKNIRRFKCEKKNHAVYALRQKVFCGCCQHALTRRANKEPFFGCFYTKADQTAPCYGLHILEKELEGLLYELICKQAQIILSMDDLSQLSNTELQSAELSEYEKRITNLNSKKRQLYEDWLMQVIDKATYLERKAVLDEELNRLTRIKSSLAATVNQTKANQMKQNNARELAGTVVNSGSLTSTLAEALIEKVYVYPGNQVEIIWKTKDFCLEQA